MGLITRNACIATPARRAGTARRARTARRATPATSTRDADKLHLHLRYSALPLEVVDTVLEDGILGAQILCSRLRITKLLGQGKDMGVFIRTVRSCLLASLLCLRIKGASEIIGEVRDACTRFASKRWGRCTAGNGSTLNHLDIVVR